MLPRICLSLLILLPLSAEPSKPVQGTLTAPASKGRASVRGLVTDQLSDLLALDFLVPANTCRDFDSGLDLFGARTVHISLLALNSDLKDTRIIPYFAVAGAPYFTATSQLRGSEFAFSDGGGGAVPVGGTALRVRVCNDGSAALRYTQLTAYTPGRPYLY